MKAQQLTVRACGEADLDQVNDIYNHYVATSPATFDLEPRTIEQRREWFSHYATSGRHRALVATDGDRVLGWATSSPVRPRRAYETSIETTVYVTPDAVGSGVGTALYAALFDALAGEDIHRAY